MQTAVYRSSVRLLLVCPFLQKKNSRKTKSGLKIFHVMCVWRTSFKVKCQCNKVKVNMLPLACMYWFYKSLYLLRTLFIHVSDIACRYKVIFPRKTHCPCFVTYIFAAKTSWFNWPCGVYLAITITATPHSLLSYER